ncbi:MAG: type II secretion system minor pseudopilin GspJ [bacterium]
MIKQRGLTLIEVMVALAIFAIISSACVLILRLTIDSHRQLQSSSTRMGEIMIMRSMLKSDLLQIADRVGRDENGMRMPGPVAGGNYLALGGPRQDENGRLLLAFIHYGNINPADMLNRSELEYVEYLVKDEQLIRRSWAWPDRQENTPITTRILMQQVSEIEIEFFNGIEWHDRWLSSTTALAPNAVRLTFTSPKFGRIPHLFYTGVPQ